MRTNPAIHTCLAGFVLLSACTGRAVERPAPEGVTYNVYQAAQLTASCTACHLSGGELLMPVNDRSAAELSYALLTYRSDADGSTVMHRIARGLSEDDIRLIAQHLSQNEDQTE